MRRLVLFAVPFLMLQVAPPGRAAAPCSVPSPTYPTIQSALNALCNPINLEPGTYDEDLVIDNDVEIIGAGTTASTIDGTGSGPTVTIDTNIPLAVGLRALAITGGGGAGNGGGFRVQGEQHSLALTDVAVTGNNAGGYAGIFTNNDSDLRITGGSVSGNHAADGAGGIGSLGGSVTLENTHVDGNTAGDNVGGIYKSTGTLEILGSTVNGNEAGTGDGGGISVNGIDSITITDTTINNNRAGGNEGGALLQGDMVSLQGVVADGNSTDGFHGGVAATGQTVSIVDSAFTNNAAGEIAGGLYVAGDSDSAPVTVTNSTISGNRATEHGGGLFIQGGAFTGTNLTITNNTSDSDGTGDPGDGGGIFWQPPGPPATIRNTILSGNRDASPGGEAPDCSGELGSGGHNMLGTTAGCTYAGGPADQIGVNPLLGPLADNGGNTLTHALLKGSPAIDAADPTVAPATDQRGLGRNPDIGAYELVLCAKVPVNVIGSDGKDKLKGTNQADGMLGLGAKDTLERKGWQGRSLRRRRQGHAQGRRRQGRDEGSGWQGHLPRWRRQGQGRLREGEEDLMTRTVIRAVPLLLVGLILAAPGRASAPCTVPGTHATIQAAVLDAACDPINVAAGTYAENLDIDRSVTIEGAGSAITTIDGSQSGRVVTLDDGTARSLTLKGLTITGGIANASAGGGISVSGTPGHSLTLDDVVVTRNVSTDLGGGLAVFSSASLQATNTTISMNEATGGPGGGLYVSSSSATLTRVLFDGNEARDDGGAIYASDSSLTLQHSAVTNNAANSFGGILSTADAIVSLTNVTVSGNRVPGNGGGIGTANSGDITGTNVTIAANTADSDNELGGVGGGIFRLVPSGGPITVKNSIVAGNTDGSPPAATDCYGDITSNGHNILGSTTGCDWSAGPSDQLGVDPMLGAPGRQRRRHPHPRAAGRLARGRCRRPRRRASDRPARPGPSHPRYRGVRAGALQEGPGEPDRNRGRRHADRRQRGERRARRRRERHRQHRWRQRCRVRRGRQRQGQGWGREGPALGRGRQGLAEGRRRQGRGQRRPRQGHLQRGLRQGQGQVREGEEDLNVPNDDPSRAVPASRDVARSWSQGRCPVFGSRGPRVDPGRCRRSNV